jgi:uncharacterized membrane protein
MIFNLFFEVRSLVLMCTKSLSVKMEFAIGFEAE